MLRVGNQNIQRMAVALNKRYNEDSKWVSLRTAQEDIGRGNAGDKNKENKMSTT